VHTVYDDKNNSPVSKGSYLSAIGDLTGTIAIVSRGSQFAGIDRKRATNRTRQSLQIVLENINNLKIKSLAFTNDKTAVSLQENVALSAALRKSISRKNDVCS
jgi:hypothetical protein